MNQEAVVSAITRLREAHEVFLAQHESLRVAYKAVQAQNEELVAKNTEIWRGDGRSDDENK